MSGRQLDKWVWRSEERPEVDVNLESVTMETVFKTIGMDEISWEGMWKQKSLWNGIKVRDTKENQRSAVSAKARGESVWREQAVTEFASDRCFQEKSPKCRFIYNACIIICNTAHNIITVVQSLSRVWLLATPWTAARLSFTISRSWLRLKLIESVMPANQLIPCHHLLLQPSIFPSIRVFSNERALHIRYTIIRYYILFWYNYYI